MQGSKLYVGNLAYSVDDSQLTTLFSAHGQVRSANVIVDKYSGQSKGFGFVEMGSPEEAEKARQALNGGQLDGRDLTVDEAKPRQSNRDRY